MPDYGNGVNMRQDGVVTQEKLRRDTYHHGDLANALTVAATELARHGGPEAVVLREAARQVGVSATAAYRHFAGHGDLIHEVKERCQSALVGQMRTELARVAPSDDPKEVAVRRLRALGQGYLAFALAEPGLFRTAFSSPDSPREKLMEKFSAPAYELLSEVLDELDELGMIDPARRPFCETAAWSTTHGLAELLVDGPLAGMPDADRKPVIKATLDTIIDGICAPLTPR
jgi:AcrR family transcriptional regulator